MESCQRSKKYLCDPRLMENGEGERLDWAGRRMSAQAEERGDDVDAKLIRLSRLDAGGVVSGCGGVCLESVNRVSFPCIEPRKGFAMERFLKELVEVATDKMVKVESPGEGVGFAFLERCSVSFMHPSSHQRCLPRDYRNRTYTYQHAKLRKWVQVRSCHWVDRLVKALGGVRPPPTLMWLSRGWRGRRMTPDDGSTLTWPSWPQPAITILPRGLAAMICQ